MTPPTMSTTARDLARRIRNLFGFRSSMARYDDFGDGVGLPVDSWDSEYDR